MKPSSLFPFVLATATAERQLYPLPHPIRSLQTKRDITIITSAITSITNSLTQLDTTVQSLDANNPQSQAQVETSAQELITTIQSSGQSITSSLSEVSLPDLLTLQPLASSLSTAGNTLLVDLAAKRDVFAASAQCTQVKATIEKIGSEVTTFIDGVVDKLPETAKDLVGDLVKKITGSLTQGAEAFASHKCVDKQPGGEHVITEPGKVVETYPTASIPLLTPAPSPHPATPSPHPTTPAEECSSTPDDDEEEEEEEEEDDDEEWTTPEAEQSTAAPTAVTVTVTAPCACETTSTTTISSSTPVLTPTATTTTFTSSIPFPTGGNTTTFVPPGSVTTSSTSTIATAGAVSNGVGAAGLLAGLAAALLV